MLATDKTHNFSGTELPALRVAEQGSSDFLQIQWQNLQQVQSWEVVANSETGFAKLESSRNVVKVPKAEISSDGAWLAYRGKTSNGFTPWSSWKFYKPPMSAKKAETEDSSQKLVQPETRLAPTRYQPLPINNSNPPTKSGPFRMPSYNGSTDRYPPQQQTLNAQPRRQPSDRIWQVALLALLVGIFFLGSLLIFSEKQDEPELTLPVPRTTLIFRNPTQNPITVDSATAAPTSDVDTPEMTTIIEPIVPSSIVTGDRDISDLIKNVINNELTEALPTEDILLSRPIIRSEIVYSKSK
jgi:hypothetical protein